MNVELGAAASRHRYEVLVSKSGNFIRLNVYLLLIQPSLNFYIWVLPRYAQKYNWIILHCGLLEWIK